MMNAITYCVSVCSFQGSVIRGMVLDVNADALYIVDSERRRIGQVNISTKAYTEVITNKGGTAIGESPMAITLDMANR